MTTRNSNANYEVGFINGIQFGVYSPEVILKKSVVNINDYDVAMVLYQMYKEQCIPRFD